MGPVDEIDRGPGEEHVVGPQIRVQQGCAGTGVVCGRLQFGEELSLAVQPWRPLHQAFEAGRVQAEIAPMAASPRVGRGGGGDRARCQPG